MERKNGKVHGWVIVKEVEFIDVDPVEPWSSQDIVPKLEEEPVPRLHFDPSHVYGLDKREGKATITVIASTLQNAQTDTRNASHVQHDRNPARGSPNG